MAPGRAARLDVRAARAAARSLRMALILVALLSLCWQSVVLQSHVHSGPSAGPVAKGTAPPGRALTGGQAREQISADCPICRELGISGHYLSPGPIAVEPAAAMFFAAIVCAARRFADSKRSHGWLSRGPPQPIRA